MFYKLGFNLGFSNEKPTITDQLKGLGLILLSHTVPALGVYGISKLEPKLIGADIKDAIRLSRQMGYSPRKIGYRVIPIYNPATKRVHVPNIKALGMLSHELGHATGKPIRLPGFYALARLIGEYAPFMPILAPGSPMASAVSIATPIIKIPDIIEEVRAWKHGLKALHKVKGMRGVLGALPSLTIGMSTYIGAAALPYLLNRYLTKD